MPAMDARPGNQIKPTAPEPEYAKINVPVAHEEVWRNNSSDVDSFVRLTVCTR